MLRIGCLALFFILCSFSVNDEPICKSVKLYEKASFPVGVALNTDKLKNEEKYWTIALAQFNSFTPEMIMKPQFIHPKKDAYNFTEIDHLTEFCKEYNIRLHGHTLVWHNAIPTWMLKFSGNKSEWEALLKDHIQTVIKHCKGKVKSWDVVNEAFNDDGTLRKNIWLKNIGEDYIEKAYQFANEADSTALFFYNDYSLEAPGAKLTAVLHLITKIRSKGIRIHGLGLQMHVTLSFPTISELENATRSIENAGLMIHYSELDVRLNANNTLFTANKKLLELQKNRIKEIVTGYMKLKPATRFGITMWGVSDNESWLTEDQIRAKPLLYDRHYKMKPAYCGFLEGLSTE